MVLITAKLKYLRIAPRKVRLAADLIRGKSVREAETLLNFTIKRGVADLARLLKSAVAFAKDKFQQDKENLYIKKIFVDEGPKYKRWMPRARGQAFEIQKKTSHLTLILDEIKEKSKKGEKSQEKREDEAKVAVKGIERPHFKPEMEIAKPKVEKRGIRRFFRQKVI